MNKRKKHSLQLLVRELLRITGMGVLVFFNRKRQGLGPVLVLSILTIVLSGCASSRDLGAGEGYHVIGFHTIGGKIPLIKASLNNKRAWFIVDTGATITILNAMESKYFGFSVRRNTIGGMTEVSGFSDKLSLSGASSCSIAIGPLVIKHHAWRSQEMNALFVTIGKNEKLRIAGILGSDILAKYKMRVNYDNNTLSYRIK